MTMSTITTSWAMAMETVGLMDMSCCRRNNFVIWIYLRQLLAVVAVVGGDVARIGRHCLSRALNLSCSSTGIVSCFVGQAKIGNYLTKKFEFVSVNLRIKVMSWVSNFRSRFFAEIDLWMLAHSMCSLFDHI